MAYADAKTRAEAWDESDYLTRAGELRNEFASLSEKDRTSDDYSRAREDLAREVDDLDAELRLVRMAKLREHRSHQDAGASLLDMGFALPLSAGEAVVSNPEFRDWLTSQAGKGHITNSPDVELRTLVTEGANGAGGVASSLLPVGQPFLGNVNRQRLFIRDLIDVQTTGLAVVPYVRELNAVSNQTSASTVAEGAIKPEAAVQFQADSAPTQVIAVNIPITTQILEDAPTVAGYINGRLGYMLKLREEAEVLAGNGITPDLKGILSYTAAGQLQTQSATAGEFAITLGNAIAKIENANGEADGVAMTPNNAWAMITKRASGGSGTFDAGAPFSSVPQTVWGLPVVRTKALTDGTAVVGSWKLGATLYDRLQANVRIFEQHSNFAVLNQVLIQAEERVALAVFRPDWFVSTSLA